MARNIFGESATSEMVDYRLERIDSMHAASGKIKTVDASTLAKPQEISESRVFEMAIAVSRETVDVELHLQKSSCL
jgi:hypothetical protein